MMYLPPNIPYPPDPEPPWVLAAKDLAIYIDEDQLCTPEQEMELRRRGIR